MIELTSSAVEAIRGAINGQKESVAGLRLMVESGGCAGFKYMMGLVTDKEPGDITVEKDGVVLFVDADSSRLLEGVTIDFAVSLEGSGFTFENPNATESCSCGKSFG